MSTITPAGTSVHEFADAVRRHLSDLTVDEIEDLTDGLEGDLTEQIADDADHDLPDPAAYADELRTAAGLPARSTDHESSKGRAAASFWLWFTSWPSKTNAALRSNAAAAWCLDVLLLLRPVWWLLRGWAVFQVAELLLSTGGTHLLPTSPFSWLLLFACLLGSIQWGRKRWLSWRWLRIAKVLVSVVAVFALLLLVGRVATALSPQESNTGYSEPYPAAGLVMDGAQISNIFAYDANGNALTGVQLFDQDGNPITTTNYPRTAQTPAFADDGSAAYVPSAHNLGDAGWNVYPLDVIRLPLSGEADISKAAPAVPPFAKAQPLTTATSTPTLTPSPSPTPTPTPVP